MSYRSQLMSGRVVYRHLTACRAGAIQVPAYLIGCSLIFVMLP